MGIPVVTGDIGDRYEILDYGKLGKLVKPGDSNSLAEGIISLLTDTHLQHEIKALIEEKRHQWRWENISSLFLGIYQDFIH